MTIKKHIPNFITSLNLACGCIGIVACLRGNTEGNLVLACYLAGLAAIFDFLDGFAARILKVHSEIGKQLDSLADMVTFGVLPGMIMLQLINMSYHNLAYFVPWIALLIPIFSALRLAKFNIDTRQTNSFIGLPTPANTIFIGSFPLIIHFHPDAYVTSIITNQYFLIAVTIIQSYLLVAELPLFALKFKNFTWNDNKTRFTFLITTVFLIAIFAALHSVFVALPMIILAYILLSVVTKKKVNSH